MNSWRLSMSFPSIRLAFLSLSTSKVTGNFEWVFCQEHIPSRFHSRKGNSSALMENSSVFNVKMTNHAKFLYNAEVYIHCVSIKLHVTTFSGRQTICLTCCSFHWTTISCSIYNTVREKGYKWDRGSAGAGLNESGTFASLTKESSVAGPTAINIL